MGLFFWKKKKDAQKQQEIVKTEAPKAEEKATPRAETKPAPVKTNKAEAKPAAKTATVNKPKDEAKPKAPKAQTAEKKPEDKKENTGFAGKFEIKKSKDGKFVFNLYAANSVIVATSQIYSSSSAAQNGIKSVIENAEKANLEDQTLKKFEPQNYPKWEIYLDKGEQYRFRLSASNGSCVCHSQGYTSKASCKNGIESIIRTVKNAAIDKAYIKKD